MQFTQGKSHKDGRDEALNNVWSDLGVKNELEFYNLIGAVDIRCGCCSKLSGIRCEQDIGTGFMSKPGQGTAFIATCANCLEQMVILYRAGSIVAIEQVKSPSYLLDAIKRVWNKTSSTGSTHLLTRQTTPAPRETTMSWHEKGDQDLKVGLYASAINCFDKALGINPKSAVVWRDKGSALSLSGNLETAIECYTRSIELNRFDAIAWFNKGTCLQKLDRPAEAVSCFDKALEIEPSDADIWCNKGFALQTLGRTMEELTCYEEALKRNSDHVDAWFNRGGTLASNGDLHGAVECFDRVLAINPIDTDAAYYKAVTHLHLRESTKALAALRRFADIAERGDPRLPQVNELIKKLNP